MVFFRFLSSQISRMYRFVILCLLLLLGVSVASPAQPEPTVKPGASNLDAAKVDYVLQPADLIRIQIFQEDSLNREVRISQESTVTLPLIDTVDLKGKTARQAQEYIRNLYAKDFLVNPHVNLGVIEYAPRRVFVAGAVGTPGVVLFQQEQGLTLIEAISRAGSFNRLADKKRVTLKRTRPDGPPETFTINVEDLMKGETSQTWPLQPGDVINVPERIL